MKRLFTVLALMLCTLLTFAQFSGSGQGTENDPYLILNPIHVNQIRNFLGQSDVYFKVMADIDMTDFIEDEWPDQGWLPIGNSSTPFMGNLNGNGHTIKGLWSKRAEGFFSQTSDASIKNLKLEVDFHCKSSYVGGVVGRASQSTNGVSSISNCTVYGVVEGNSYVGGIVGYGEAELANNVVNATIEGTGGIVGGIVGDQLKSKVSGCVVIGTIKSAADEVGGIIGRFDKNSEHDLTSSYALADVISTGNYVGGLVGNVPDKKSSEKWYTKTLSECYFQGSVSGNEEVGGLVGHSFYLDITNSYSRATIVGDSYVGGLCGYLQSSTLQSCIAINSSVHATDKYVGRIYATGMYNTLGEMGTATENKTWNKTLVMLKGEEQSISDSNVQGTGASESTLKLKATYVGAEWNFNWYWTIQETESFPYFKTQPAPPIITSEVVANATQVSGKSEIYSYVTLEIDGVKRQVYCSNNQWSFTVEPLKAGHEVSVYAEKGNVRSYYSSQVVSYAGKGTESDPFRVYTAEDLVGVYRKGYYKLMNDIDLSEWINKNSSAEGWTGIGREGNAMNQFDGDGHTISGLWSNTSKDQVGLFSLLSNSTIKNLTVKVLSGKNLKGGDKLGLLIGESSNCTISNCVLSGTVEGSENVGGGIGYSSKNQINNITFSGTVKSNSENANVGGILGLSQEDQISKCISNVSAFGTGKSQNIGGLIGKSNSIISECVAKGTVNASYSNSHAGGIAGVNNENGDISNCLSSTTLISAYSAGGIVSYNYGKVSYSLGTGNITTRNIAAGISGYNDGSNARVTKCAAVNSKIDVTFESQQSSQSGGYGMRVIGGLMNDAPTPSMYNYALKTMQVSVNAEPQKVYDDVLNGTAKTDEQLKTQTTYEDLHWDFTDIWFMNSSTGYPDLMFNKEKEEQSLAFDGIPVLKYGDTTLVLPSKTNEGLSITWSIDDNSIAVISGNVLTIKKAGTAIVSALQNGNSNYKKYSKSFDLKIEKATVTITANSCSRNVGADNPDFTLKYDGFVNNENESVLRILPTMYTEATIDSPAGAYDIIVSGAVADNYEFRYVKGQLNIVDEIAMKNTLYVNDIKGRSGTQFLLPINMKNEEEITALQFELTLPEGISIALNSKNKYVVEKTDRCLEHTLSASKPEGATAYTILLYSPDVENIDDNDGAVVNVRLEASDDVEAGNYEVSVSKINLTRADEVKIAPANVTCTLSIINSIPGDANGDGTVDVTDIVAVANKILGRPGANFDAAAADVNGDGTIDVTDIVAVANIILRSSGSSNRAKAIREVDATPDPD